MKFLSDRSKLGYRPSPNISNYAENATIAAIDTSTTKAVVIEVMGYYRSTYSQQGDQYLFTLENPANNHRIRLNIRGSSGEYRVTFEGSANDLTVDVPMPENRGLFCWTLYFDLDGSTYRFYENGTIAATGSFTTTYDLDDALRVRLGADNDCCADYIITLSRLSYLTATITAAQMDDVARHQFSLPYEIHSNISGIIANCGSRWSIDDVTVEDGTHSVRILTDTGTVGGEDLTATVDLEDKIVIVEKASPITPDKDWYVIDNEHNAVNAAIAGHGIGGGAHMVEIGLNTGQRRRLGHGLSGWNYMFRYLQGAHEISRYGNSNQDYDTFAISDASGGRQYNIYQNLMNHDIIHIVIEGATTSIYLDGQRCFYDTNGKTPDFTGVDINMFMFGYTVNRYVYDLPLFRHYNYPGGTLPTGWEAELKRRVTNPWKRSAVFTDAALKLEYLLNEDTANGSTTIVNSANPGTGDLTISGGDTFVNARIPYKSKVESSDYI